MKQRCGLIVAILLLIFASLVVSPQTARAATYTAGTLNDLIAAIAITNAATNADTIILTANITLTIVADSNTTYGDSGLPVVTSDIIIEGQGHSIIRNAAAPDFRILRVASGGTLTLYNLMVSGGKATSGTACSFSCGGALYNEGTLTTFHTGFSNNEAENGGAFYNNDGSVAITDSNISNNDATHSGGGLYNNSGEVTIKDSVFSGNTAINDGGGVYSDGGFRFIIHSSTFSGNTATNGGGIAGNATISRSTFSNNVASSNGGGAYVSDTSVLSIGVSTFYGNTASNGGGIFLDTSLGNSVVISSATFVGNKATSGGGIYKTGVPDPILYPPLSVLGSIIAQSEGGNCVTDAGFEGQNNNLADDSSCPDFTDVSIDPVRPLELGSLADNGGPTQTIALGFPSPALDAANIACFTPPDYDGGGGDQRGISRGLNALGAINVPQFGDCDIGSFEANGIIHTLQFESPSSTVIIGPTNTYHINLTLDGNLGQAQTVTGYVWISGGTAIAGQDYVPFGVQTIKIATDQTSATASIDLLNVPSASDKTIILSFATLNGPGFSGAIHLGTQLTHTVTLKISPPNSAPSRNFFTINTPTLTWNRTSQAFRYEIQVSDNSLFTGATIYDAGNNLSIVWPEALINGTYNWHVRVCTGADESSCGAWSYTDTFTVFVS